jgi:hypothetical protein
MSSRLKALPVGLALVALLLSAATASAQTYTVTRTDDPIPGTCDPGDCSLREAVMASNSSTGVDDVVAIPANPSPYVIQYEFLSFYISDETEVRGAGADQTVVKGDGLESIFAVGTGIKATIAGLTITNGTSAIQSNGELLVRGVSIEGIEWNGGTPGIITNGPLTVESSFIGYNRANTFTAGAIFANAPVTIVNSTIAHNSSKEGPGAISGNSSVTIVNSAVVSNRSEAASMAAAGGTPLSVRNSEFADNRDANGLRSCTSAGPLTSFGGNISDDASCGTGASDKPNVNPLLGTLALHDGTTKVYDLLPGSPAIDAAAGCPALDQRGVARPQGAACDSGPYELVPAPAPLLDRKFFMKLGKKLRLGKRGVKVTLSCPSTEASPPCRGRVLFPLISNVRRGSGAVGLTGHRVASARFTIGAGRTKAVAVRLLRSTVKSMRANHEPRKILVMVRAENAAGNVWGLKRKRPLVFPKRG